jgi:hypothetical protein
MPVDCAVDNRGTTVVTLGTGTTTTVTLGTPIDDSCITMEGQDFTKRFRESGLEKFKVAGGGQFCVR